MITVARWFDGRGLVVAVEDRNCTRFRLLERLSAENSHLIICYLDLSSESFLARIRKERLFFFSSLSLHLLQHVAQLTNAIH